MKKSCPIIVGVVGSEPVANLLEHGFIIEPSFLGVQVRCEKGALLCLNEESFVGCARGPASHERELF